MIFSAEEATVLYMGANLIKDVWGKTYHDAVTSVTAKLDNVLPDALRQQVALAQQSLVVSGLMTRDARPWEPILHTLRQCIGGRCCVQIRYRNLKREDSERVVEPYALAYQMGQWYLVGYCRLRQELRTFRIDRIQRAEQLEQCFTVPDDFDLQTYMRRTMYEPSTTVVVRFSASIAALIREDKAPWMHVTDQEDGSILVRFGVSTLEWVVGWVLSYGGVAKVLEPPELIARVRKAARGALQQYTESA
jgi:predicted DNA-binding transcriptional regulator YafY